MKMFNDSKDNSLVYSGSIIVVRNTIMNGGLAGPRFKYEWVPIFYDARSTPPGPSSLRGSTSDIPR